MRSLLIHLRAASFAFLAGVLWAGWLPLGLRAAALRAVMARNSRPRGISRQVGMLAAAIARAGAVQLSRNPGSAARIIRRAEASGARSIVIAGDSHSKLYIHRLRTEEGWLLPLHHLATAASARGLGRVDSRTGQGEAISGLMSGMRQAHLDLPVVLVFGQVDIEFVYIFKRLAEKPPAPLDEDALAAFCAETIQSYVDFGARLAAESGAGLHLATIFPPALSDAAWRQGYVNANIAGNHTDMSQATIRGQLGLAEIATLAERTRDHSRFNDSLRTAAANRGVKILDVATTLPMQAGAVSPKLLGPAAGADHHLDGEALEPFITPLLWAVARGRAI
jgi:hypothetical protein